jgi:myo-inositol-1(or 4)-monophosphatase
VDSPELTFAITIARQAGALLRDRLASTRTLTFKGPFDIVTEVDQASEALLTAAIRARYPEHGILGEEGGVTPGTGPLVWALDPVDGTTNYAHQVPYFCVTLGLLHDREVVLGVTYDPIRDELFSAETGRGAFCNGQALRVSTIDTLAGALLSTGFPYDFATRPDNNAAEWAALQALSQGVRRGGSAGLDLAYVAAGRLEAHWEPVLNIWDVAAGLLLVREAGGVVTDYTGAAADVWSGRFVAANRVLHPALLAALQEAQR